MVWMVKRKIVLDNFYAILKGMSNCLFSLHTEGNGVKEECLFCGVI